MKKRKKTIKQSPMRESTPNPNQIPNPTLPNDILVSCLARVSRLHYPALSLASKTFQSLLTSPELYETRSSLNQTESCLYVCLKFRPDPTPRWFTLCKKPNRPLTTDTLNKKRKKKKSSGYVLASVPIPNYTPAPWSSLVSVGSDIYSIGGSDYEEPLSKVMILDCRSHTWREAPSMQMKRYSPAVNVVDGKIYVAGGCEECDSSNWMEVFDLETETWELVSSRGSKICGGKIDKSAGIDGKVFIFGTYKGLAYEPKKNKWERVGWEMDIGWPWTSYCVVENLLYCYYDGKFKWYDTKVRYWRFVEGLKGLPKFAHYCCVRLTEYGGKMAVLWDKYLPSSGYKKNTFCCAVIALERRSNVQVFGKVEWHDGMLIVPSYEYVCFVSATV